MFANKHKHHEILQQPLCLITSTSLAFPRNSEQLRPMRGSSKTLGQTSPGKFEDKFWGRPSLECILVALNMLSM